MNSGVPSNPFGNITASDGYLKPPGAVDLSSLGYGGRPPIYGSRLNVANLGYPSGPITSSRLTNSPFGNTLYRYPSLNPQVHPIIA